MSVIGNPLLLGGADAAFTTQRSVRMRRSSQGHLRRTVTAGSTTTWTFSAWVKRGILGASCDIFSYLFYSASGPVNNQNALRFNASDALVLYQSTQAGTTCTKTSSALFRDPSAWYHIVAVWDTTNSVAADRLRLYVNGVRITAFSASTDASLNLASYLNSSSTIAIGATYDTNGVLGVASDSDMYITEVNFIDGQALTPSAFGEYDSVRNTQWKPKAYSGSWGTNGFYLPFGNNASVEALGYDSANRQSELVTNGMFVANVTGWTAANGTTLSWQSGSLARVSNTASAACEAYIPISTIVGQTYYVQFNVAAVSLGAAGRSVGIYKADNTAMSSNIAFIGGTVAGTYRGTFTATATTTYIFLFGDTYGSGSADFSSVSVSLDSYKNNWKPFGVSLTAGVTYDSMTDVPTLTSESASNFATWNPLSQFYSTANKGTAADGNLKFTVPAGTTTQDYIEATLPCNGKCYVELQIGVVGTGGSFALAGGVAQTVGTNYSYNSIEFTYTYSGSGTPNGIGSRTNGGSNVNISSFTPANNDVYGFAIDADTGKVWVSRNNGAWIGGGDPVAGTTPTYTFNTLAYPLNVHYRGREQGNNVIANFGQRPFAYTPPTGFKALNTYNLLDGAVTSSDDYHKVYTYIGNGGGQQVGEIQKPLSLFNLDRSLRFRASATGYLSRTATVPTSAYIWTTSAWIKLGSNPSGGTFTILGAGNTTPNWLYNYINSADGTFQFYAPNTGATVNLISSNVFKDPLLWYHVVIAVDTTQATPSNRIKIYVNNVQLTFTGTITYPAQNATFFWNQNGVVQRIGSITGAGSFDGYMADFYGIDGQQLTPDSFGQYDGNYYWTPKAYSGTYGAQGFHLEFEDFSAATAAAIGKDTSGQGNNWTPSAGINLTTPANTNASWDSMVDVPTSTSADVANYCTLNPLRSFVSGSAATFTDGNLAVSIPAVLNPPRNVTSTYDVFSGKWYWEVIAGTVASNFVIGIASKAMDFNATIFTTGSYLYDATNGNKYINGTASAYGATYTTNDVIGIALDMDAGTLTFYKNGVSQGVAVTGLQGLTVTPVIAASGSSAITGTFNFGQRPFKYSNYGTDRPAATFKPINSFNIAEVTGDLESPDFVWIKSRSASGDHALFNSVTGVGKYLRSNASGAEITDVNSLIQFNKNGFLLGNATVVNASATTFVASAWKAAATTVTNTAGTITTQVRASPTAGISVVTYTGTLAGSTIGHGLGAAPKMVIIKNQGTIGTQEWLVGHASIGWGSYLLLSSPNLRVVASNRWNNTDPTSSVITLGSIPNSNTEKYVAYCFAEINGFSKFGSYLSNNDPNGPFVYTGFRPRWLMVKRAIAVSGTGGWFMYDASRNTYNVMDQYMFAEGTAGDNTLAVFDFTSNGFKIRSNNVHVNTTAGDTYIYMAFAEHPFKYSLAR